MAIEVRDVSKQFNIHHDRAVTIKDQLLHVFSRKRISSSRREILWAVKNVSLSVEKGTVVGLVGPNGSGKSTLLRLIAGIYPTTQGSISVSGTVAPLIGLNLGFHNDLTGEENIYLNASLFGHSRRQIKEMYPKIVEFSELEHFIDTPTRNYSSGMLARLGFSIATHISAEIYLLDEILAVGDAQFKEKCLARVRQFKESGKTIFFVSHSMESISDLCDRAIMLVGGKIVAEGSTEMIVEAYGDYMQKNSRPKKKS